MITIHRFSALLSAAFFLAAAVSCGGGKKEAAEPTEPVSQPEPESKAPESVDQPDGRDTTYKIIDLDKGGEIGKRRLKITEGDDSWTFEETMEVTLKGKVMGWTSTVIYSAKESLYPTGAEVETTVNGKVCMQSAVTFEQGLVKVSATILSKKNGDDIDPPIKGEKGMPLPEGTILFQSSLQVIGPLLLPQQGELQGVVMAEFPDDIDNPINLKKDWRMVRKDSSSGSFSLKLYYTEAEEPTAVIEFDAQGKCLSESPHKSILFMPEK